MNLPSLGEENKQEFMQFQQQALFPTVGAMGSFAPVGDELVADIDPEERYIDDADDSAYDEDYTETGAYAGRGYVDMPKSRAGRLFGKFRKKKKNKQDEVSVNDWVDVDDSYDARSVGKHEEIGQVSVRRKPTMLKLLRRFLEQTTMVLSILIITIQILIIVEDGMVVLSRLAA